MPRSILIATGALGAAFAASGLAAAGGEPVSAAKGDDSRTIRVRVVEREDPPILPDGNDFGAGDRFILDNDLYDAQDRRRVGRSLLTCLVVGASETAADQVALGCQNTLELPDGHLTVNDSFDTGRQSNRLAVSGGTGRYEGASGQARFTFADDRSTGTWEVKVVVPR